MTPDRALIFASAGLRACAVSLCGVILALHLASLGHDAGDVGLLVSVGLGGAVLATLAVAAVADRLGRRRTLILLALLMTGGGFAFASSTRLGPLLAGAFLGMMNGMGRDRGAAATLEQAMLPRTTSDTGRTRTYAWYNVTVDAGHAVGALLGGLPALLRARYAISPLASYQGTWQVYAFFGMVTAILASALSSSVETRGAATRLGLRPATRRVVVRLATLSGLDSLGGGFLSTALLSYWFFRHFNVDESLLGPLFFAARVLNGLSHLGAAWLARRIGLVNTMVFTHLPSSLVLMTVPFAPNLATAIVLFLLREALVEMDVPTRQSYLAAVVPDEERTRATGITNLTRNVGWASAPVVGGSLMGSLSVSAPLLIGPALKIAYDVLLFRAFRNLRPPEER